MPEYEFSFTLVFPYNNTIVDFALIHENTGKRTQCSGIEWIKKQPPTDVL